MCFIVNDLSMGKKRSWQSHTFCFQIQQFIHSMLLLWCIWFECKRTNGAFMWNIKRNTKNHTFDDRICQIYHLNAFTCFTASSHSYEFQQWLNVIQFYSISCLLPFSIAHFRQIIKIMTMYHIRMVDTWLMISDQIDALSRWKFRRYE